MEALNKILAEKLFKVQDAQELNDPETVSSRWVKHLYGLVEELYDTQTEMIGTKPKSNKRIILKKINYLRMDCIDTYYNPVRNTTTNGTEQLREVIEDSGNRVMYYLLGPEGAPLCRDGTERAFVSEELMLIPEDTELPPDYVQEW